MWRLTRPQMRHFIAFAVFVVGMLVTLYFVAQNTDSYEAAEQFVRTDVRIEREIGAIHGVKFKFWDGFDFASTSGTGRANFTFEVTGVSGILVVQVHLRKDAGAWHVVLANARQNDNAATFDIKPKG